MLNNFRITANSNIKSKIPGAKIHIIHETSKYYHE